MHRDLHQVILVRILEGLHAQRVLRDAPALLRARLAIAEAVEALLNRRIAMRGCDGKVARAIFVTIAPGDEDIPQPARYVPQRVCLGGVVVGGRILVGDGDVQPQILARG